MAESSAPKYSGPERRKFKRYIVCWPVEVRRIHDGRLFCFTGHTGDVSQGGVRVYVDGNASVGETVYVRMTVEPHGGNTRMFVLEVIGRVRHASYSSQAHHFELGIKLNQFKDDGAKQLADVIAHFERNVPLRDVTVFPADQ